MEFSKEDVNNLTKTYIGKAKFSEIVWMMCMTNLMNTIDFENDISTSGEDDCVVEIKLQLPKKLLVKYLRAMDKTTADIELLVKNERKELVEANKPETVLQKFNGAFFIAGMTKLIHDNAKQMVKFIMQSDVMKDKKEP